MKEFPTPSVPEDISPPADPDTTPAPADSEILGYCPYCSGPVFADQPWAIRDGLRHLECIYDQDHHAD